MDSEPTPTPCTVTCHTEGCELEGVARTVNLFPNGGGAVWRAQCSPCGQMITDVVPLP